MAETGRLTIPAARRPWLRPVTALRIAIIAAVLVAWEALAASGLLYRDVVPSLGAIGKALFNLLTVPDMPVHIDLDLKVVHIDWRLTIPGIYWHLYWTFYQIIVGMVIGCLSGLVVGIAIGGSRLLRRAYEPMIYYLGPCPKIIFFPVALNAAGGMREIDQVLIRVGRSFRANTWQMVTKIYLPAMRHPIINGMRIGLGVCLIGTLLAETKLSNSGVGFLVIQAYSLFNMPLMYALLIVLFVIAIGANALIGRLGGLDDIKRS